LTAIVQNAIIHNNIEILFHHRRLVLSAMPIDRHAILFEPLPIGPKTLRNRFYQVPHATGYGTLKPSSLAGYRATRAEGGWAAVNMGWAPVCESTDEWPGISARIWDAEDARRLRPSVEHIHEHGALAGIELHHGGVLAMRRESRWHALSPSGLGSELPPPAGLPEVPKEMDRDDIEIVQQAFVNAAVRARDTGFDIIYVYAGCGYLMAQFMSPFHNKRTDEYGGSVQNRARMWIETLTRVREAVGDDCAIASRLAADTDGPWGHGLEDTLELVRMADHLVDLWDVNMGSYLNMDRDISPSRFFPQGHNLEWIGKVRTATDKPIVGVSRMSSPDVMADAVRDGSIDLVGSARQSIADPFFPQKVQEGRLDELRECMGVNACLATLFKGHMSCAQNATAGEEFRRGWHPEKYEPAANAHLNALVVGAGPAGLECAIVLAKRGFQRVHLVEATDQVGGTLRWIPRLPGLAEWGRFLDYRLVQLAKLPNVDVIVGTRLDADSVREYGAELVIVATGASWSGDGLSPASHEALAGADAALDHVFTPEQIMVDGQRPPAGTSVAVYDTEGYFMGAGIAELLHGEGYAVHIVTPHQQVAGQCDVTGEGHRLRTRLHELGIVFHRSVFLTDVAPGRLSGLGEFGEPFTLDADATVLVTHRLPENRLYRELVADRTELAAAGIQGLFQVGDCVSPRMLVDTVFDGHRLGREIDSPHPEQPLPYLHESIE
jgi:dimethylamine/trimethylamine dehydrogenase